MLPSRDVLKSALEAGIPVIVSESDGIRQIVRDRLEGFVIPKGDASALHRIVKILLSKPDMIETMRESILKNHRVEPENDPMSDRRRRRIG